MSGRGLDHLIEQNETDLGFLSAYGGGESPEELLKLIENVITKEMKVEAVEHGVMFSLSMANLPLVSSDIERRGFLGGKLTAGGVEVVITDFGPEQRRFIERLVEFIQTGIIAAIATVPAVINKPIAGKKESSSDSGQADPPHSPSL